MAGEHWRSRINCWQITKKAAAATYLSVWFTINKNGGNSSIVGGLNGQIDDEANVRIESKKKRKHRDRKNTEVLVDAMQ